MAGTSRPSSSSNPPISSQIMPRRLRESLDRTEAEIRELQATYNQKVTEKKDLQKSIDEKKEVIRGINKDIRKEERKLNALEQEFPMIDEELRDKYILVAHIKEIYPDDE